MQISRLLKPEMIKLEMDTSFPPPEETTEAQLTPKQLQERKERILAECVDLLDVSGKVCNKSKLLIDLFNREKKASTALGKGIAVPHVRSMQSREFIIAIARSSTGYDFDAPDGEKVHLFIPMAAPPYDDNLYLRVFKSIATLFSYDGLFERIMAAKEPYDIIRSIRELE